MFPECLCLGSLSFTEPESHRKDENGIGIGSVKSQLFFLFLNTLDLYMLLINVCTKGVLDNIEAIQRSK